MAYLVQADMSAYFLSDVPNHLSVLENLHGSNLLFFLVCLQAYLVTDLSHLLNNNDNRLDLCDVVSVFLIYPSFLKSMLLLPKFLSFHVLCNISILPLLYMIITYHAIKSNRLFITLFQLL